MIDRQNKFMLNILAPEKKFLEKEVSMVTVPAFDGEIGILPDHISIITYLNPGLLKVYQDDLVVESVFIYGGFVEVNQGKVTVLIADAVNKSEVNLQKALNLVEEIELKLLNIDDPEYQKILKQELAIYNKMVEVSKET